MYFSSFLFFFSFFFSFSFLFFSFFSFFFFYFFFFFGGMNVSDVMDGEMGICRKIVIIKLYDE